MESNNSNNNQLFLCEFKELRKELSAVKKRIVQLEESQEKQQEKIDILERENHSLKTQLNIDGSKEGDLMLRNKRMDQVDKEENESKSTLDSVSAGKKKTKTKTNNILVPRYDNRDSFDSLSDDLLHKIVEFDGNCYSKFGSINKRCKNIYDVKEYKLEKVTCLYGYGTVDMMLEYYLQSRKEDVLDFGSIGDITKAIIIYNRLDAIDWIIQLGDSELLQEVCFCAANFGKINILTRVFCKCSLTMLDYLVEDDGFLCSNAADKGHLETLKWLRNHGARWDEKPFIAARREGYDEMMQYLRAEGCPVPYGYTDESSGSEQFGSDDEDGDY